MCSLLALCVHTILCVCACAHAIFVHDLPCFARYEHVNFFMFSLLVYIQLICIILSVYALYVFL